ncbi:MAG TPA: FAD-dependent oxidoreductase [Parafilimonas sp.]|nr:FAD-dependent oxidoreductase [Parafilimonas sp.]
MSKKKVIIIGGGVAGMSAAHELIERGFDVQVFEKKIQLPGGKARSVNVPDPDAGDHYNPLPGEHGFRFFPGFYKHVTNTMSRIPFPGNKNGVLDNLVAAPHVMLARSGAEPIVMLDSFPKTWDDFKVLLNSLHAHTGLTAEDEQFFATRVWQLMTSCRARRENDYERMGWWQYTDGEHRDKAYQDLLARGLTRTLVAARAATASTKTGGDIFLQLLFNMGNPKIPTDRILNGPTNQQWLFPWHKFLVDKGVDYRFLSNVKKIDCENGMITGVWVEKIKAEPDIFSEALPEKPEKYTADYYICAVPVEVAAPLFLSDILKPGETIHSFVNDVIKTADLSDPAVSIIDVLTDAIQKASIMKADPTLTGIVELSNDVSWMTGVQFYLNEAVTLNKGHIIFSDSPWAITAIAQQQFWTGFPMSKYADGKTKSVLSCDVSDWDEPGVLYNKPAKECKAEEIKNEVWEQMKRSLVVNGKSLLNDEMIHTWFIDRDIEFTTPQLYKGDYLSKNTEPLLVNKVDTWRLRPESYCAIPNLFLAADYVRTHTDLATMEGANEAARRAVNNIIEASGSDAELCEIWDLHEPWEFAYYRYHDQRRYRKGLKWQQDFPWWVKLIQKLIAMFREGAKKSSITKPALQTKKLP